MNTYYYFKGEVRQIKRLHNKYGQTTKRTTAKLPTMEEALKIIAEMDEEERIGK